MVNSDSIPVQAFTVNDSIVSYFEAWNYGLELSSLYQSESSLNLVHSYSLSLEIHSHVYRHYLTTILRDNKCSEKVIRYIRSDSS